MKADEAHKKMMTRDNKKNMMNYLRGHQDKGEKKATGEDLFSLISFIEISRK